MEIRQLMAAVLLGSGLGAGMLFLSPSSAQAHRDGCHRQHSCPSDSGSYVCGDTGNFSECGTAAVPEAPPKPKAVPGPAEPKVTAKPKVTPKPRVTAKPKVVLPPKNTPKPGPSPKIAPVVTGLRIVLPTQGAAKATAIFQTEAGAKITLQALGRPEIYRGISVKGENRAQLLLPAGKYQLVLTVTKAATAPTVARASLTIPAASTPSASPTSSPQATESPTAKPTQLNAAKIAEQAPSESGGGPMLLIFVLVLAGLAWLFRGRLRTWSAQKSQAAAQRRQQAAQQSYALADNSWNIRRQEILTMLEIAGRERGRTLTDFRDFPLKTDERVYAFLDAEHLEQRRAKGQLNVHNLGIGRATVTSKRIVFRGEKNREWEFNEWKSMEQVDAQAILISVVSRIQRSGLRFGRDAEVAVLFINLALADALGDRSVIADGLRQTLAGHDASRPRPPADVRPVGALRPTQG